MSVEYIGDFYFSYSNRKEYDKNMQEIDELMARHYEFYGQLKTENEYVTSGSILYCNRGSKLTKFDIPTDHGVTSGGAPLGVCNDCKPDYNIYSFGGCTLPKGEEPQNIHVERKSVIIDKTAAHIYEVDKCIPMLDKGWQSQDEENFQVYDYTDKQYYNVLSTGAFLTCLYGGIIKVIEVYNNPNKIEDKYYAPQKVIARDAPKGNQINGDGALLPGAIAIVCQPIEKVYKGGHDWIKISFASSNDKVAWVALDLIATLPEPIKGYTFKYNWKRTQYVDQAFEDKVVGIAMALDIAPDDLMTVMAYESGFNPSIKNSAGGSATGLIQFMPTSAKGLNTTTSDLAKMSGVEQLDYVFGYIYGSSTKVKDLGDIYMRILNPSAIGIPLSGTVFAKPDKGYNANGKLDLNGDGKITKEETMKCLTNNREGFIIK